MLNAGSLWQQRLGAWLAPGEATAEAESDPAVAEFRRVLRHLLRPPDEPAPDEAERAGHDDGTGQP